MREDGPEGFKDWREYRRHLAFTLVQQGMTQKAVAEMLDVTQAAVSQWVKRAREGGREALASQPYPSRARKLAEEHMEKLIKMLSEGAAAHGFGEEWTLQRMAEFIEKHFGVRYHPSHVSRLLHQYGFDWQSKGAEPA